MDAFGDCIVIADSVANTVTFFDGEGVLRKVWGDEAAGGPEELDNPRGVSIGNHWVFVCDTDNGRIKRFTKDGVLVSSFEMHRDDDKSMLLPVFVASDRKDNTIVVCCLKWGDLASRSRSGSRTRQCIQRYTEDGWWVANIGPVSYTHLTLPTN